MENQDTIKNENEKEGRTFCVCHLIIRVAIVVISAMIVYWFLKALEKGKE